MAAEIDAGARLQSDSAQQLRLALNLAPPLVSIVIPTVPPGHQQDALAQ